MTYALDTNIYQVWRNINDPAIKRIRDHPTIQTIEKCFNNIEAGETLVIPRIILTEHLIWIAKIEGIDTAFNVLDIIHNSSWKVVHEDEELHRVAVEIGSKYGGMGAADLLLSATAKQENATIITMDVGFKKLNPEIDVIVLESITDLL